MVNGGIIQTLTPTLTSHVRSLCASRTQEVPDMDRKGQKHSSSETGYSYG